MDRPQVGKTYGPFTYEVGAEKIREFARAVYGGNPSPISVEAAPEDVPSRYLEGDAVIAPPTFCVNFAIKPFVASIDDPELGINKLMLVHGEQQFEFLEPVRAGDTVTTTGKVASFFEKSGMDFLTVATVSKNQHGREVVRANWTAVIRK